MSSQYYGVFDSVTGEPKRFGTCDVIDVAAQASEPNEVALVCPPETTKTIQNAQGTYEAKQTLPKDRRTPFASPFKAETIGDVTIIAPA